MTYWEQQEQELLRKENAWFDELSPFMKLVDDPFTFFILLFAAGVCSFGIGFVIGMML